MTWTYVVTNTSQVTLTGVVMTDSVAGVNPVLIAGDTDSDNALAPTEIWTFRAVGTATTGQYANIGTVRADWVDGTGITDTVTATDPSHYFGLLSQVQVTKSGVGQHGLCRGQRGLHLHHGQPGQWPPERASRPRTITAPPWSMRRGMPTTIPCWTPRKVGPSPAQPA